MTLKKKLLSYTIYLASIYSLSIAYLWAFIIPINVFIGLFTLFLFLNLVFGKIFLKTKMIFLIIPSTVIPAVSLYIALSLPDRILFPAIDPYGVMTAIISNGLISVILWEIVYHIISRQNK